tara:strand:- start:588 stop:833 length:246 start_codon:yes stop_codon:yes gene_type:complete
MKEDKKYESAALGSCLGFMGITVICLGLIIMNYFKGCNVKSEDTPIQTPTIIEQVVDTLGEIQYSDEHVMWIGGNGDTIWE